MNIKTTSIGEANWPTGLGLAKGLVKIHYAGELSAIDWQKCLAVVGSRKMTRYGQMVLEKIMPDLVAFGVNIVSGLMYGVDDEAHRQCLNFGGKTVAVVGGGIEYISKREIDSQLFSRIIGNGVVLSEYENNFKPTLWSFPQRNRIVAAIANMGVVVIEADIDSGSLITARIAKKMGRKVMAVPGPVVGGRSAGCNYLIKNGLAKMVTEASDIVGQFGDKKMDQLNLWRGNVSSEENDILTEIEIECLTVDELAKKIGKEVGAVNRVLSGLQLKDLVEESAGRYYLKS